MKNNFKKTLILSMAAAFVIIPMLTFALPALAQDGPDLGVNWARNLELSNADPRNAAVSLVKLLMTFLGIIAVVIILYGGFVWLTAAGNEDKVASAKKIIGAGIIGLIIILAAFLIVNFVIENVSEALQT